MVRQRRGSGGRGTGPATPIDLSATLGSLLRTTLEQMSVVGEAALERARASRERSVARDADAPERTMDRDRDRDMDMDMDRDVDDVVLERKRRDALARLGTAVYKLALRGELGALGERTEIARLLANVESLDEELDAVHAAADRRTSAARSARAAWQGARAKERADDTVSSADWKPPAPTQERMRVWRPTRPALGELERADQRAAEQAPERMPEHSAEHRVPRHDDPIEPSGARGRGRSRRRARMAGAGHDAGGGIAFVSDQVDDEDSDLAEYMHDDDVADLEA